MFDGQKVQAAHTFSVLDPPASMAGTVWDPEESGWLRQASRVLKEEGTPASETEEDPGCTQDTGIKIPRLEATHTSLSLAFSPATADP